MQNLQISRNYDNIILTQKKRNDTYFYIKKNPKPPFENNIDLYITEVDCISIHFINVSIFYAEMLLPSGVMQ